MPETPIFQSERVALRAFEPEDIPGLQLYLNHPDLSGKRYIPGEFPDDIPLSKKQVDAICEKWSNQQSGFTLAVTLRESQNLIGHAGCDWGWDPLSPDSFLVITPVEQRKGYGSEVLQILLDYLFERTAAHNVSMWMADWNQAARQFSLKHGFQENGRWRRDGIRQGAFFDTITVDILRREWIARKEGG